ncbi:MAG: hypothetical protein RLZZ500_2117 [Bacteroidota bacterium]|jgi:hypothetical protein
MINPSAHGWIDKFFAECQQTPELRISNPISWYEQLRTTGFIYGHCIAIPSISESELQQWDTEEISKVALLNALYELYVFTFKRHDATDFTQKALGFYKEMSPSGFGELLQKLLPATPGQKLENYIDGRVQTNKDILRKNFSHIITNALLFIDVLAFEHYLQKGKLPEKYLKRFEETLMGLVSLVLQIKTQKSAHDDLLIKLFEASVRYTQFSKVKITGLDQLALETFDQPMEALYLLDIATLSLWSDGQMDNEERYFLYALGNYLNIEDAVTEKAILFTDSFITTHKKDIHYFNYSHPVKHFYDQTTQSVIFLIKRNKKRLTQEIRESKELMQLLAKSTQRDLDAEEKKKVKKQLLDICKSVPSLTIFLLPGGSLLLPILIKFIPQLLPSAFNENLDD